MLGLPTPIGNSTEYKKVESALECGLPNEVDFAFNVCTLLSNEGKHIIKVCRCPRVLTLLLAHVGIFEAGKCLLVCELVILLPRNVLQSRVPVYI